MIVSPVFLSSLLYLCSLARSVEFLDCSSWPFFLDFLVFFSNFSAISSFSYEVLIAFLSGLTGEFNLTCTTPQPLYEILNSSFIILIIHSDNWHIFNPIRHFTTSCAIWIVHIDPTTSSLLIWLFSLEIQQLYGALFLHKFHISSFLNKQIKIKSNTIAKMVYIWNLFTSSWSNGGRKIGFHCSPLMVLGISCFISVQIIQILYKFMRCIKVFNMNIWVWWCHCLQIELGK